MTNLNHVYASKHLNIYNNNCLDVLRAMPDNYIDSVVTDPPYGLSELKSDIVTETICRWVSGDRESLPDGKGFMDRSWDSFVPPPAIWDEVFRVLKPGGYLLAFSGARTQDLMGLSVRLAGFSIKDTIAWINSQGFPHGLNITKKHKELSPDYDGYNTSLKPSNEPIIVAQKPIEEKNIINNIKKYGTGSLDIGDCRIGKKSDSNVSSSDNSGRWPANTVFTHLPDCKLISQSSESVPINKLENWSGFGQQIKPDYTQTTSESVVEHWECAPGCQVAALNKQSGFSKSKTVVTKAGRNVGNGLTRHSREIKEDSESGFNDEGGASRFFYCAKANKKERPEVNGVKHPTCKPISLMQWLVRLVTPPNGVVLDPFAGSGSTVEAALLEGYDVIGVEMTEDYIPLIQQRIDRNNNG